MYMLCYNSKKTAAAVQQPSFCKHRVGYDSTSSICMKNTQYGSFYTIKSYFFTVTQKGTIVRCAIFKNICATYHVGF